MQISFNALLTKIGTYKVINLPLASSEKLPSRGMVMISGTMNGIPFQSPLEPDGKGSHWLEVSDKQMNDATAMVGQVLSLIIEPVTVWPEPEMPQDLMDSITLAGLLPQWSKVSVKAKWEWLRWIRSTSNPETREKRILVTCSKLSKGDKRPCCFDTSRCTVPEVSKSGILIPEVSKSGVLIPDKKL